MISSPQLPRAALSRPEILAPASTREMMKAAIENGADAIYFGLQSMNARLRAANFTEEELPEIMAWLHERGVKGYVTLNTLVFSAELDDAARVLQRCSESGVDAILVQDLGLAALAHKLVPDLPIHASTQMTLSAPESLDAARQLGLHFERVVAPRENNLREVQALCSSDGPEIEVFVHGAICVAYSGQCLTSEAMGGRSANRGECAQACRLPYEMQVDGETHDTEGLQYLLSPMDLAAYEDVGALINAGVASLKIEGRLKSPQYVAATVQSYREAIDKALPMEDLAQAETQIEMPFETRRNLDMTFSRGFTGGYLHETNHQAVVDGSFPAKRGTFLGYVGEIDRQSVIVELEAPLSLGDGIVFEDLASPDREQGGRVYEILPLSKRGGGDQDNEPVRLTFANNAIRFDKIPRHARIYKTSDPAVDKRLAATYASDQIRHRRPISLVVSGGAGQPLKISATASHGNQAEVFDTEPAVLAEKHALSESVLRDQLGRLGNTPYQLDQLTVEFTDALQVPFSRLNAMRRELVAKLIEASKTRHHHRRINSTALNEMRESITATSLPAPPEQFQISALCRTLEQVEALATSGLVGRIYTEFENMRSHKDARALITDPTVQFAPATLRIMKPRENGFLTRLLDSQPDAILVRNLAAWEMLRQQNFDKPLIADYALNASNEVTANLLALNGFSLITPSYDLNIDQLEDFLKAWHPGAVEITLHQQLPMFHMEHCVFCRYLSEGTDFTNCGRPCEEHTVTLKDRMGFAHPVKADSGCRNTVYQAVAQSAAAYLDRLKALRVRRYRVELLDQTGPESITTLQAYHDALRGEKAPAEIWKQVKAIGKLGVTRGSLDTR